MCGGKGPVSRRRRRRRIDHRGRWQSDTETDDAHKRDESVAMCSRVCKTVAIPSHAFIHFVAVISSCII